MYPSHVPGESVIPLCGCIINWQYSLLSNWREIVSSDLWRIIAIGDVSWRLTFCPRILACHSKDYQKLCSERKKGSKSDTVARSELSCNYYPFDSGAEIKETLVLHPSQGLSTKQQHSEGTCNLKNPATPEDFSFSAGVSSDREDPRKRKPWRDRRDTSH